MRTDGPTLPLPDGFPTDCPHGHGVLDFAVIFAAGGLSTFTRTPDGRPAVVLPFPFTVDGWCHECGYTAAAETPDPYGESLTITDPQEDE